MFEKIDKVEKCFIKYLKFWHAAVNMLREHNPLQENSGIIQKFFIDAYNKRKKPVTIDDLKKWNKDTEHGFLHGFLTGFIAFILKGHAKENRLEKEFSYEYRKKETADLFCSILIHDFCRIHSDENHDENLKNFFPNALSETFTHTNSTKENESILIQADRLALLRYTENWFDSSYVEKYVDPETVELIDFFYKHYYPKLKKMFDHMDDCWITHHLEDSEKWDTQKIEVYPQRACYDKRNFYCVWYERLCRNRKRLFYQEHNHIITGYIPCTEITQKPYHFPKEHPSLEFTPQIALDKWIITYLKESVERAEKNDEAAGIDKIKGIDKNNEKIFKALVANGYVPLHLHITDNFPLICTALYDLVFINTFQRKN